MKASVITLQNIKNYGSMLQAYATQELIRETGIEAEIIDYTREDARFWNHILAYSKGNNLLIRLIKTIILLPTEVRYKFLWESFKRKWINSSEQEYFSCEQLMNNPPVADFYCSGSDQVWNSGWNGGLLKEFFLSFAPENTKKIALASSIGTNGFLKEDEPTVARLLNQYSDISVREVSGVGYLNKIGISGAVSVIDPTLTVDKSFWDKFNNVNPPRKPYILIYQLGKNKQIDEWAHKLNEEMGYDVLRLCIRYDHLIRYGKPILIPSFERFISLFSNASVVLTDSFHATCFSLNFQKNFWCVLPDEYQGRITEVLNMVGLADRVLKQDTPVQNLRQQINYDRINPIVETERIKVRKFYKKAFQTKDI